MNSEYQRIAGQGVIIFSPDYPVRVGRERLEALRVDANGSSIDREIVEAVGEHAGDVGAIVFSGTSPDGANDWAFDPGLRQREIDELGRLMVRSQVPMYRHLAAEGVLLSLKVGWGPRETSAFQAGTQHAVEAAEAAIAGTPPGGDAHALRELDLWLMRFFSTWLLASLSQCRDTLLPRTIERVVRRRGTLARLVSAVPTERLGDPFSAP